jgi:hypothetical protein
MAGLEWDVFYQLGMQVHLLNEFHFLGEDYCRQAM